MKHTYRYLRPMRGDRDYMPGDVREMDAVEAKHLVDLGVVEDLGQIKEKADPEHQNKAAPEHTNKSRKGG